MSAKQRRFLKGTDFGKRKPGPLYPVEVLYEIARDALFPLWAPDLTPRLYWADNLYACPSIKEAQEIIHQSHLDSEDFTDELFDCDDYSVILKANFSQAAYLNKRRDAGYAFGIVWFEQPGGHAMNWMINDDGVLRFVEPQWTWDVAVREVAGFPRSAITLAAF